MGFWEVYSKFYDNLNGLIPYRRMLEEVSKVVLSLSSNPSVLDIGCGTGNLSKLLADKGCQVQGLDFSQGMLSVARQKCTGTGVLFHECNIESELPVESSSINVAVAVNVFYTLTKQVKFLNEVQRVLDSNGYFILINPINCKTNTKSFVEHCQLSGNMLSNIKLSFNLLAVALLNAIIVQRGKHQVYSFMSQEELTDLLESNGFQVVSSSLTYSDQAVLLILKKEICRNGVKRF